MHRLSILPLLLGLAGCDLYWTHPDPHVGGPLPDAGTTPDGPHHVPDAAAWPDGAPWWPDAAYLPDGGISGSDGGCCCNSPDGGMYLPDAHL